MLEGEVGLNYIVTSENFRDIPFCLQLFQHHLTTTINYLQSITIICGYSSNLEDSTICSLTYLTDKKEILQSHRRVVGKQDLTVREVTLLGIKKTILFLLLRRGGKFTHFIDRFEHYWINFTSLSQLVHYGSWRLFNVIVFIYSETNGKKLRFVVFMKMV